MDDLGQASHRHGHGHGSGHRRYERDGVCGCGERTTYGRRLRCCCLCEDKRNDENRGDATEGSLLPSSIQATSKASTSTSSAVSSSSSLSSSSPLPAHVHSGVLPGERRRRGCSQARDGIMSSSSASMTGEDNIALVASGSGSGSVSSTSTSSSTAPASNFYSAAESSPSSSSSTSTSTSSSTSSSTLARTAADSSLPPPPSRLVQSELSLSRSRAYRKRVARQYYALCELVETERTYVGNLRVLVDVSLFFSLGFFSSFFRSFFLLLALSFVARALSSYPLATSLSSLHVLVVLLFLPPLFFFLSFHTHTLSSIPSQTCLRARVSPSSFC